MLQSSDEARKSPITMSGKRDYTIFIDLYNDLFRQTQNTKNKSSYLLT